MNEEEFAAHLRRDTYQVFLFTCPATMPFMFARHPWFVVNRKGTISRWEVFWQANRSSQSWGHLHKDFYPPLRGIERFFFSDRYFWGNGRLLGVIEGNDSSIADTMTEFIDQSPQTYPYSYRYFLTGPNSNTYVQWVLDHFPEAHMQLPWNAFGKHSSRVKVFKGIVEKGSGYAARLGFPTVNIPLADGSLSGIYTARVIIKEGDAPHMAAVFADPKRKILEAHILDFAGDLVGQEIEIELFEKLRDTEKFETEEELRAAIARDAQNTRAYFAK